MQLYPTRMNREHRPFRRLPSNSRAAPDDAHAALTDLELRELIEETALLRARRRGRPHWTAEDWREAEAEALQRIGL